MNTSNLGAAVAAHGHLMCARSVASLVRWTGAGRAVTQRSINGSSELKCVHVAVLCFAVYLFGGRLGSFLGVVVRSRTRRGPSCAVRAAAAAAAGVFSLQTYIVAIPTSTRDSLLTVHVRSYYVVSDILIIERNKRNSSR